MFKPWRPALKLLDQHTVNEVVARACEILENVGVQYDSPEALGILGDHGAVLDTTRNTARIGGELTERALRTIPATIDLYDASGKEALSLGGERVAFMPGGTAPFLVDVNTGGQRPAVSSDIVQFVRLVDALPNIQINNPCLTISDVPGGFEQSYRYFLTLLHTAKPLAGGGVSSLEGLEAVREMMAVVAGGDDQLRRKPRNYFSCCPTSPLRWDEISGHKLMACARHAIPALIIPAPGAGGTAPVSLLGTILQLTVEILSGIVLHQLVRPGAPLLCGAAATVMDMRNGTNLFAAVESHMINAANAQIVRHLGAAAHGIVVTSEAKTVDAQAGLEAAQGLTLGALAGLNVISGPGMLESGLSQSLEKMVIDHDICSMALRLVKGIDSTEGAFAGDALREVGHGGNYLAAEHTLQWMRREHCPPPAVLHRSSRADFENAGSRDSYQAAAEQVRELLSRPTPQVLSADKQKELVKIIRVEATRHGLDHLPVFPFEACISP